MNITAVVTMFIAVLALPSLLPVLASASSSKLLNMDAAAAIPIVQRPHVVPVTSDRQMTNTVANPVLLIKSHVATKKRNIPHSTHITLVLLNCLGIGRTAGHATGRPQREDCLTRKYGRDRMFGMTLLYNGA